MPALLTSTSIRPPSAAGGLGREARDAARGAVEVGGDEVGAPARRVDLARRPRRRARRLRPLTTTCAPSAANAVAIARPMLLVAPVTSAVLSSSRVLIWIPSWLSASRNWTVRSKS